MRLSYTWSDYIVTRKSRRKVNLGENQDVSENEGRTLKKHDYY
jgi:hypothetical protein